jgi:hypothetical protein
LAGRPSALFRGFRVPQSALIHQNQLCQLVRWMCDKLQEFENVKRLENDTRFTMFIEVFRDILNKLLLAMDASLHPLEITVV